MAGERTEHWDEAVHLVPDSLTDAEVETWRGSADEFVLRDRTREAICLAQQALRDPNFQGENIEV